MLLNLKVANYIRSNIPFDIEKKRVEKALDILESPWERRDERNLRGWFEFEESTKNKVSYIIKKVLESGLEPFITPAPLPPINKEDIKLISWMAIYSEK